jgi:hypothetical protein
LTVAASLSRLFEVGTVALQRNLFLIPQRGPRHDSRRAARSKSALLKSNFSLKERIAQKQFLAMPSALTIEQITTGSA